jgi:hypothetical protein
VALVVASQPCSTDEDHMAGVVYVTGPSANGPVRSLGVGFGDAGDR